MAQSIFDMQNTDVAWCPGCGNYSILIAMKRAFSELDMNPRNLVIVSGIGQAAKAPHYLKCHVFNGLHGRALPVATAVRACNPSLMVVAQGGDGDMYGEGGNHFIHTIRRNPDIAHLVHDNRVYGLTKGQASPTSSRGFVTPVQPGGVKSEPFNPLAVAVALDASFAARVFCGQMDHAVGVLKQALTHKGYALVNFLQNCVTFNKVNTFKWYKEHTTILDESYDCTNRTAAFAKALETDPIPLGVIYKSPEKATFEETLDAYVDDKTPICKRTFDPAKLSRWM
jgi:2-oxoglutarate ferredoxin oxidoreductase subunit beta